MAWSRGGRAGRRLSGGRESKAMRGGGVKIGPFDPREALVYGLKDSVMRETELSGRQIRAVVLVIVIIACGFMSYVFIAIPTQDDLVGSRRSAIVSGMIAAMATVWFSKLMVDAVRDRRRGIERGPARVSGWFDLCFGAVVALGGITCTALTYWSAAAAGGGMWTLYYGMIAWGVGQMFVGYWRVSGTKE